MEGYSKQKAFVVKFCYWAAIALILYGILEYALPVLYPFVAAGVIAFILNRPINVLAKKLRAKRQVVCIFIVVLFFATVGILFSIAGAKIVEGVKDIVTALPSLFTDTVVPFLETAAKQADKLLAGTLPQAEGNLSIVTQALSKGITVASSFLVNTLTDMAALVPSLFLKTIITIIATVFIVLDYEKIKDFLVRQIPESKRLYFHEARLFFGGTVLKCLGAYLVIMGITFTELLIGLSLLSVPNAVLAALLIAVVDILPVLGTGSVVIPWAVICFVTGDFARGAGLLILYLIITLVRNTIEPKLVGRQMGLHPVVTFAGMLIGLHYMGLLGMFGVPLTLAFISSLNEKKLIHLIK